MPAKSEAQRRLLNAKFGHDWVRRHHFDNTGALPEHVGDKKVKLKHKKTAHHEGHIVMGHKEHEKDKHASSKYHEMNAEHGMVHTDEQEECGEGMHTNCSYE